MLAIGLTGGIGSGKTAVSDAFARRGAPLIDTDIIARELVTPGQPALDEIVAQFGPECLTADGALDRHYLREKVFADPKLRRHLEAILHPRIRQAVRDRLTKLDAPYCLVVIPLLVEAGMADLVQRVLVVDVAEKLQIRRVMTRDHMDEDQVRQMLAAQATREQRLALADDVIENEADLATLDARVADLHEKYLTLAAAQSSPG